MKGTFRHFEHNKKVDLIGLGNAIVDIIVNIEDEFLEINNLDKGSMNLINSDESQRLLENCKVIKQISGGSSANTVVCLAELGNVVQFIGRVKNDQFGDFFSDDIKKSKTIFNTPPTIETISKLSPSLSFTFSHFIEFIIKLFNSTTIVFGLYPIWLRALDSRAFS